MLEWQLKEDGRVLGRWGHGRAGAACARRVHHKHQPCANLEPPSCVSFWLVGLVIVSSKCSQGGGFGPCVPVPFAAASFLQRTQERGTFGFPSLSLKCTGACPWEILL